MFPSYNEKWQDCLSLEHDIVKFGTWFPTFRRSFLPSPSGRSFWTTQNSENRCCNEVKLCQNRNGKIVTVTDNKTLSLSPSRGIGWIAYFTYFSVGFSASKLIENGLLLVKTDSSVGLYWYKNYTFILNLEKIWC
jgi:hypothetical protein